MDNKNTYRNSSCQVIEKYMKWYEGSGLKLNQTGFFINIFINGSFRDFPYRSDPEAVDLTGA